MDATPESFAYRCLPLAMANSHGWEITSPCRFAACWRGGSDASQVEIQLDDEDAVPIGERPVSLFGQGTVTFHIAGLFRTAPGWNLWVGGPPNVGKDGIAPLSGLIETDWSPYSFTMNWQFTRRDHWVVFEADEAIAFFFPVERAVLAAIEPRIRPIAEAPELARDFEAWSRSRDAFHEQMRAAPPSRPADKWQKLYYRGVGADGAPGAADHQIKLSPAEFTIVPSGGACPRDPAPAASSALVAMSALAPQPGTVERRVGIAAADFLEHYYAANRPVILTGEIADCLALARTFAAFAAELAETGGPSVSTDPAAIPDATLQRLHSALPRLDKVLLHAAPSAADQGSLSTSPEGSVVPLGSEPRNRLHVQLAGHIRAVLAPPVVGATLAPGAAPTRIAELAPGEVLFVPLGWGLEVLALASSVAVTYRNFRWRNDFGLSGVDGHPVQGWSEHVDSSDSLDQR